MKGFEHDNKPFGLPKIWEYFDCLLKYYLLKKGFGSGVSYGTRETEVGWA